MQLTINPTYESLRDWLTALPHTFFKGGTILYDARNQIRAIVAPDGRSYCVKRYRCPVWYNRIIYSFIRSPKCRRAYDYAHRLNALGIATPCPVAFIRMGGWLIAESYLITEMSRLGHCLSDMRFMTDSVERESLLRALARFTAHMHDQGVLHLDYSPGNILFDRIDNRWQIEVIDINRLRFGRVDARRGCANFARLWGDDHTFHILAEEYARARGFESDRCLHWVMNARRRYWQHKHPHPDQYRA